ncbi:MAG TPA: hypothetical protein VD907_00620 [Verrucomicrobiae bacterium]|nr:hypothetical protein [Verrucomicrobiae bacterium]
MSERTATILYGDELRDGKPKWALDSMLSDRAGLARHLANYDISLSVAAVRSGEESYDIIHQPEFDDNQELIVEGVKQISGLELGRVILDRHTLAYGQKQRDLRMPQVNETEVQAYGANKLAAYKDIHGHLPEAIPTFLASEHEQYLEAIPDGPFIAKPIKGSFGVGIKTFASKAELQAWVNGEGSEAAERYIFQPKYDFTKPLPGLRPYSPADEGAFLERNYSPLVKEVRMYTFYNATSDITTILPVARHNEPSLTEDRVHARWFFVQPEPLLERLAPPTTETARRLAQAAGATAVYISVDFGYGERGAEAPDWRLIESNSRFTRLIDEEQHPEIGAKVRDSFARHVGELLDS